MNDEKQVVNGKKDGLPTCIVDSIEFCGKLYHKVPCLVADLKGIFLEYAPDFIVGGDILRDRPLKFNRTSMMIEPFTGKHEKGSIILKWKDLMAFAIFTRSNSHFINHLRLAQKRRMYSSSSLNALAASS